MKTPPYGKTFPLLTALTGVECWNFTSGDLFTLPAGTLLKVEHVNDATHTTCMVVDEQGNAPGIELEYVPTYHAHIASTHDRTPRKQTGYRFIVENQALGAAIGVAMPKRTADLVGDIIAHETGTLNARGTRRLVKTLRKTGLAGKLQGRYGRLCAEHE